MSLASATKVVYPDITVEFDIIRNSEHESGRASKDQRPGLVGPSERTSCLQRTAPILAVHHSPQLPRKSITVDMTKRTKSEF